MIDSTKKKNPLGRTSAGFRRNRNRLSDYRIGTSNPLMARLWIAIMPEVVSLPMLHIGRKL